MTADTETSQPAVRSEALFRWLMIGVFGGVFLVYFVAHVFESPIKAESYTNSYSTSPGGHRALFELLGEEGREVTRKSGLIELPEFDYNDGDTLVMLEPGPGFVDRYYEEFTGVFDAALDGNASVVVTLPKRSYDRAAPQPEGSDKLVLYESLYSEGDATRVLKNTGLDEWFEIERVGEATILWQGPYQDPIGLKNDTPAQVLKAKRDEYLMPAEIEILARTEQGSPVIVRYNAGDYDDRGGVILISDPDFLTNRFFDRENAGAVALEVFSYAPPGGRLIFNEDIHGFSTEASLEYLALTPPGLWVTLSVVALLLVFGWRQATVLRPRKSEPQDRRARKYAIEGLARMMERARDHHTAYRRVLKRSWFVLGAGHSQVMGAGMAHRERTGIIDKPHESSDEQRLISAARHIAQQIQQAPNENPQNSQGKP